MVAINELHGGSQWAAFLLENAKYWKGGKIGQLRMEVRFNSEISLCDHQTEVQKALHQEIVSRCDNLNEARKALCLQAYFNPCEVVDPKTVPEGYQMEGEGRNFKLTWNLKDFSPAQDLRIHYIPDYLFWNRKISKDYIWDVEEGKKRDPLSCEELRILRNSYYSLFGYPFKSEDLKAHFAKQPWYKENTEFDIKKLPRSEQQWLNEQIKPVQAQEKAKKCKK